MAQQALHRGPKREAADGQLVEAAYAEHLWQESACAACLQRHSEQAAPVAVCLLAPLWRAQICNAVVPALSSKFGTKGAPRSYLLSDPFFINAMPLSTDSLLVCTSRSWLRANNWPVVCVCKKKARRPTLHDAGAKTRNE